MRKITDLSVGFYRNLFENGIESITLPFARPIGEMPDEVTYETVFTPSGQDCEGDVYFEVGMLSGEVSLAVNAKTVQRFAGLYGKSRYLISACLVPNTQNTLELKIHPYENHEGKFTFGSAKLIFVPESHFRLENNGTDGVQIKTLIHGKKAEIRIAAQVENPINYDIVTYRLTNDRGVTVETKTAKPTSPEVIFQLDAPRLWDGPYAANKYFVECTLQRDSLLLDSIGVSFGVRRFEITEDSFFALNAIKSPVNGVALTDLTNAEDDVENALRLGVGAVKITGLSIEEDILTRCDEAGLTVFLFLPYKEIKPFEKEIALLAQASALHPSVAFLGTQVQNEDEAKLFCKTVKDNAQGVFSALFLNTLEKESVTDAVPDVIALTVPSNTAMDELTELGRKFADVSVRHPDYRFLVFADSPVCLFDRHSDNPTKNDSSQEYLSKWHEKLWATFCSQKGAIGYFAGNLTDGKEITARKGLMTEDREEKKDIFWFYRAQFSVQDFIKLCSGSQTAVTDKYIDVKCYTAQTPKSITVNGKTDDTFKPRKLSDCVYVFKNVKLKHGNNYIVVQSEKDTDSMVVYRVKARMSR